MHVPLEEELQREQVLSLGGEDKLQGALSSLRHFLKNENPLKMMKNAYHFTLKALLVLKIFKFLSWFFCHVEKRLDFLMTS